MIYTVTLNPAVDRTMQVQGLAVNAVNRAQDVQVDAGGKGINVSRWVRALGGQSVALGILGGDTGRFIERTLHDEGIETAFTWQAAQTRTNIKIVDTANKTQTDINMTGAAVQESDLRAVYDTLTRRVRPNDIVVLAGKNPPGTPVDMLGTWMDALHAAGAKIFLDVEGDVLADAIRHRPFLIKPNEHELAGYMGQDITTDTALAEAIHSIFALHIERIVVSLGAQGAVFAWPDEMIRAAAVPVPVGSTVGAGDAMVAALAFAQAQGLSRRETARLAMAAGAASVIQPGTRPSDLGAIEALRKSIVL